MFPCLKIFFNMYLISTTTNNKKIKFFLKSHKNQTIVSLTLLHSLRLVDTMDSLRLTA